ncbi:MAG: ATP-binding protein, partial [Chloroflexia bacterium]|nr:ATP-binding protein [Chloroflexia bacterium]
MALSNRDRVNKGLELLQLGLRPFVERELLAVYGKYWVTKVTEHWPNDLKWDGDEPRLDASPLLRIMWEQWNSVFGKTLGHAERSLVSELRDTRHKWAHQEPFSTDDTYRALDSVQRLLTAISAPEAADVDRQKQEVLRLRFEEQTRRETRKVATAPLEGQPAGGLRPWREIITPHPDVASGRYQQAEFAADLAQVYRGEGSDEYRDPRSFFQRTFITEGLRLLLVGALRRLSDTGGDPVVELQTNFGGGKTHSMLALYHLCSGAAPADLPGSEPVLSAAGVTSLPSVRRAVLVGTALSPAKAHRKADGTEVRT